MTDQKPGRFRLRHLLVNRVAFVDRGANPHADIVLYKRDGEHDVVKATKKEADGEHPSSDYAYVPDPGKPSTWKLRIDDAAHVSGAAAALGPGGFRGQGVDIPSSDLSKVKDKVRAAWRKFYPDRPDDEMPAGIRKQEEGGNMTIDKDTLDASVREYVDGLEADLAKAREEVETAKHELEAKETEHDESSDKDEADTEAEVEKNLDPKVAEILKAERDRAELLEKRLADAEEAITKSEIEKADAAFAKKAEAWKYLAVEPEKFGPVLRRVAAADPEAEAEIERVLTSANAVASESFGEIGKGGSGPTEAMGKLEAMAKAHAADKNVSTAEAMDALMRTDEGAALYAQHKAQKTGVN
jgi:hypothetical protein